MAARTIAQWGIGDAAPNSGTFPDPGVDGQFRPFLSLAVNESFDVPNQVAPQGLTTPLTLVAKCRMASATSGNVQLRCAVEAITPGDTVDTDAASSFDSNNDSGNVAVPGTAGYLFDASVTLTNADSIAAGDYLRLRISRVVAASSEASGDLVILAVELRDDGG